jgi:hypothetical protein
MLKALGAKKDPRVSYEAAVSRGVIKVAEMKCQAENPMGQTSLA